MVEHLPGMNKAQGSISSTAKIKKRIKNKKKQ
jgi:hypothetical protein